MSSAANSEFCKQFLAKRNQVYEDHTDSIRSEAAAERLLADLETMHRLKLEHAKWAVRAPARFEKMIRKHCKFMLQHQKDVFKRLMKGDISVSMAKTLFTILHRIEKGELNQEQASEEVGRYLFRMAQTEEADRRAAEQAPYRKKVGLSFEDFNKRKGESSAPDLAAAVQQKVPFS